MEKKAAVEIPNYIAEELDELAFENSLLADAILQIAALVSSTGQAPKVETADSTTKH